VDVAPDNPRFPGWQADWNVEHPAWKQIVAAAEKLGFVCGAKFRSFPDCPHLQWTGTLPVTPTATVRKLFAEKGLPAVWQASGLEMA